MNTRDRQGLSARRLYRCGVALLLTVIGILGVVGTAAGHTDLTGSDPADGSTLTAPPGSITLTFNEPVQNFEPLVVLTGPAGQTYPTSPPIVDGNLVRADVPGLGPAGTYTIAYRVVSVDGHPVTGQVQFELAATAAPTPIAPPAAGTPTAESSATAATSPVLSTSAAPSTARSGSTSPALTTNAAPTGLAVTSSDGTSGPSGWVFVALMGVGVLIAAAAVVIVRQRRRPPAS